MTNKNPTNKMRLSVCIPIYNFEAFIGDTLESIISQATDEVEIVVVDGGSSDNTQDVINGYQTKFSRIRYVRLDKRGGIDADMAKTIELAAGDYCWLFGGDDIMAQGALKKILNEIDSGHDLYLCESTLCTFDLKPLGKHRMLNTNSSRVFDFNNQDQRMDYFKLANNTAAFFSFCSSLIIKKVSWDRVTINSEFMGSHWAHAVRILEMIPQGLKVMYIPESCLYKRGDNDSFLDQGMVRRHEIAINGYNKIADKIFGHYSLEAFYIRRSVRRELTIRHMLNLKLYCDDNNLSKDKMALDRLALKHYSDPNLSSRISLLAYKYTPMNLYRGLKIFKNQIKMRLVVDRK